MSNWFLCYECKRRYHKSEGQCDCRKLMDHIEYFTLLIQEKDDRENQNPTFTEEDGTQC